MTATTQEFNRVADLRRRWQEYQSENRRAFRHDAAHAFGVSEAELLAVECGDTVTRLDGDWQELLKQFKNLGRVMTITRNEHIVHERKGNYHPVSFHDQTGLVLDEGIDLRLFMKNWSMAFAAHNPENKGYKRSIQFFDAAGHHIHKVFVGDEAADAFDDIVGAFRSVNQNPHQPVSAVIAAVSTEPDEAIDASGLRDTWANLQDTHDFFPMLKKFKAGRTQAFRLVGEPYAVPMPKDIYRNVFTRAAETELPIMVFVGNHGCIQIHTGPIARLFDVPGWFNIMDSDFNLHLREEGVSEAWLTRKPTKDGVVTGIELFDADGRDLAIIFGKRKPGIPELEKWTNLCNELEREHRL